MEERELKKLSKSELVEIIYQMQNTEEKNQELPTLDQIRVERRRLKRQREFQRTLAGTAGILIVVAAISILVATMLLPVLQVSGDSMEPTLEQGEILGMLRNSDYETGEIIGFYYQNKILLKRVIGVAGDSIDIDEAGNVFVNEIKIEEPYLADKALGDCDINLPYQVPEGKVFVMGDHRSTSIDSRNKMIGCVSEEQVVGKAAFRIWPLDRMGFLN